MTERKKSVLWTGTYDALVEDERPAHAEPRVRDLTEEVLAAVYQPIVEVATGDTWAHEALVRCKIPAYSSPPELFRQAVLENMTGRLGRMIRNIVFATVETPIFVNIHPAELSSRWLVRPDDPLCFHVSDVFLEITESATFTHYDLCMGILREVCSRTGAHLVIDDFGAGYSNLNRILELEPRIVKLDRELIANLDRNERKQTLVAHMVSLCEDLGAEVVAEGVERAEELRAVIDCGVQYVQGLFIGAPAHTPLPISPAVRDSIVP